MPPLSRESDIPTAAANETDLCRGKQFVDATSVKANDDLTADHDGRGAAALVRFNQLLQR
jgi:hypothetical protein